MKFPPCHICGAVSKLSDIPQTKWQFLLDRDTYVCKNGHIFEDKIPLKVENDHVVRADM